ncbi:hypothetical protein D9758_015466 [Tetrapyrgos nigripes]|uniref:DUF6534 domain-containing protein n=1 Tax=Tetrapyrgos nigripes TaxID=182062 RepID=A0A8H5FPK2_9AGAR|nr:hypothetical protein D9758_015466 [Tetrapyrgos nigripes]
MFDRIVVKIAVFAALACDMASIIADCADVYLRLISPNHLDTRMLSPFKKMLTLKLIRCIMAHGWHRKDRCSTNATMNTKKSACKCRRTCDTLVKMLPAAILWLLTAIVADLLIALLLVLYYQTTDHDRTLRSSSELIRRLVILALKTGSFTALIAVLALVTYVTDLQSNVTLIFGYCMGRIYSLTLFYNLNIRRKLINRTNTNPADLLYIHIPDLEEEESRSVVPNVESRS